MPEAAIFSLIGNRNDEQNTMYDEFIKAIDEMNDGKSPGPDKVSVE